MVKPCGTRSRYVSGCRCDDCRAANSAYQAEWAAKRADSPEHRERRRMAKRRYNQTEKGRAAYARYFAAHGDAIRARARADYAANTEKRKATVYASRNREQADTIRTSTQHGTEWTPTEDAELIRLYRTMPVRALAAHLHRTAYGVRNRVQVLRSRGEQI